MKRGNLCIVAGLAAGLLAAQPALAGVTTTTYALADGSTNYVDTYTVAGGFAGSEGSVSVGPQVSTITFNDWGYSGPGGRTAKDWAAINGFGEVGQVQHVVTLRPDYKTPDAAYDIKRDLFNNPVYTNANMDGSANFFHWGYTSPGYDRPTTQAQIDAYRAKDYTSSAKVGSQFNNMQIDLDGDYHVAKADMNFGYYNTFSYVDATGVNLPQDVATNISFQPYAASDAIGWCGSVLADHPATTTEAIAGQLKFDFAFDVYLFGNFSSVNIAPEFEMRSYGTLAVDVWSGAEHQTFTSDAVVNNTNPDNTDRWDVDPNFANLVSFHGAGVLPDGVWLSADSVDQFGNIKMNTDGTHHEFTIVAAGTPGAVWHYNAFGGYAWILRADGIRLLDYYNESVYGPAPSSAVPAPTSMLLVGAGLAGLCGLRRRRENR